MNEVYSLSHMHSNIHSICCQHLFFAHITVSMFAASLPNTAVVHSSNLYEAQGETRSCLLLLFSFEFCVHSVSV